MRIKQFLKKKLPNFLLLFLNKLLLVKRILFWKYQVINCPICKKPTKTFYSGLFPWIFLTCSGCYSLGRQRIIANYLTNNKKKIEIKSVLHFAAETCLVDFIHKNIDVDRYDKVDFHPEGKNFIPDQGSLPIDIENIDEVYFKKYDLVICNHVLEHVNFIKAIPNLKKLVKKNGYIFLTFPIIESWEKNYINEKITSYEDRTLHFQQFDHLQLFGKEIKSYLSCENFSLIEHIVFGEDTVKYGIAQGETLFILKRNN